MSPVSCLSSLFSSSSLSLTSAAGKLPLLVCTLKLAARLLSGREPSDLTLLLRMRGRGDACGVTSLPLLAVSSITWWRDSDDVVMVITEDMSRVTVCLSISTMTTRARTPVRVATKQKQDKLEMQAVSRREIQWGEDANKGQINAAILTDREWKSS